ncbi:MAG: thiamine pyrophosphate-dependent dehydrogenase E1 component subunit alpha [Desulfobacteraceae bacterium]|nr:thiamine pyrophosphate-dependent dehydrogenase E1 component subunit alpha [Desulfobacteraceae bacterium]
MSQQKKNLSHLGINRELQKKMFYSMLRIRRVQERIDQEYLNDQMKTPVHLCVGQEAIAVGACEAIEQTDYISSNHRGHGHYLAKGGNLKKLIAELHCKSTGCSGGFGGSMHIIDTSVGHLGSSSIVGGGIPLGTGMALASKMKNNGRVSVVFFGDGAADEGVLYESINFAILRKLPVIFILENNKWAVCSPVTTRQTSKNIFHRTDQDLLLTADINGNDIAQVYKTMVQAVNRARSGEGPSFIECDTYRILGHAGCETQDPKGYRELNEINEWKEKCPIKSLKQELMNNGFLENNEIEHLESMIKDEIDDAFAYAVNSPLPSAEDLHGSLFSE